MPVQFVKLGDHVEEATTGLKGTVVCISQWLGDDARSITVQPRVVKDGKPAETSTFNESKVRLVKIGKV